MARAIEIYERLARLFAEYPETMDLEFCACGSESRLNVFRKDPNGPITGLSLEDVSVMQSSVEYVNELIEKAGVVLSEEHKEFLIHMWCFDEASEQEMKDFLEKYGEVIREPEKKDPFLIYKETKTGVGVYYQERTFIVGNPEGNTLSRISSSRELERSNVVFSHVSQVRDFLKKTCGAMITSTDIMAGYFEARFGIGQNLSRLYMDLYNSLVKRAMEQADEAFDKEGVPKAFRDYGKALGEEEMYATHDEIIGHFLCYYMDDPLAGWNNNPRDRALFRDDKNVAATLKRMFGKRREQKLSLDAKVDAAMKKRGLMGIETKSISKEKER